MKPAKRSSELKSRTGSSLMGRSNSFATLLRAEARGFAQVFLQSGSCRRLPPPLTCSCLEPCVGTRPTRAPPRRHGAAWKPHGCPLNIPSGLALAPPLSVTPPRTRCTRVHIPAGDLQQPHGRGWVSGAGCSPRGQRQSWLWGLAGPPKGEGMPGWLGFTGAVKKNKKKKKERGGSENQL